MKASHILAVIIRLFSIALFIYAVNSIPFIFSMNQYQDSLVPLVLSLIVIVLVLFVAVFLWKFPLSIARKITEIPGETDTLPSSMSSEEFASICFFTLGLYLLYRVTGELVYWVKFLNDPLVQQMQGEIPADQMASLWALGIRTALVVVLLFGNKNIVQFLKWLRKAG
jgi:hypothetical protein